MRRFPRALLGVLVAASALLVAPRPASATDPVPATVAQVRDQIGADVFWDKGFHGQGVDVALIDTGIAPVPALRGSLDGPDLSLEAPNPDLRHLDSNGHGTHLAGIITGRDPDTNLSTHATGFLGMAPRSRLVSLKVGEAHGAVDVTQVVAAIDWVVYNRQRHGMNIRVLNLSFGTDASAYEGDPLAYAIENAWRKGIVVVTSAGNGGASTSQLTDPALHPWAIAVGATDSRGTETRADDVIADFSANGSATRAPDVVAPGVSIVSTRSPGSYVDLANPGARVGSELFRGSGTSQASAVVTGAVALLLSRSPDLTPDQVKKLLVDTAVPLFGTATSRQGAGQVDIRALYWSGIPSKWASKQSGVEMTGLTGFEASRAGSHLEEDGIPLTGDRDIFGHTIDMASWFDRSRWGSAWGGDGRWMGVEYTGAAFDGNRWMAASSWPERWSGNAWTADDWAGNRWANGSWSGAGWSGNRWAGGGWDAGDWNTGDWSTAVWG